MLPQRGNQQQGNAESAEKTNNLAPSISLPKGGGAIRGIDEKFSVNPATGTGSLSVPIFTSPGRSDFSPKLSLNYDSGAGNGPFGLGWNLSIPSITRKTDKGVPKYQDAEESDTFILSGAEDLVPLLEDVNPDGPSEYNITRYRPRIEGLFARIEKWEHKTTGEVFWKSISKDNITSIYGKSDREGVNSRITDPEDSTRVFKWLLQESYDDKGNVILYEYKQENENNIDPSLPQEKNRIGKGYANCYLKRIKYGNIKPRSEDPDPESDYLFEVVFDYGEHDKESPTLKDDDTHVWESRQDAFSSYRAGFEIRTQRLCQRVLMFHHFEELGTTPCLVRSTDFSYQESPIVSYLVTATQTGYVKKENASGYNSKSLPPLEFSYTKADVDETIHCVEAESLENLPIGLDGAQYQWVDLDGEGISGILTEQANAWFYKRNLGNTRFAPTRLVATKPSPGSLQNAQIMDLAGDGQKDLVLLDEPLSGFYERTEDGRWNSFVPFASFPNVHWNDPNLRFVDLNGDGHADVLVTEDEVFTWYPSEAEDGFGPSERVLKAYDEEQGPTLVFADAAQSVYLADMSGDGLSDIVRIRNGDVCYWPNLGYGRFGAKVTMDTAPYFDSPDLFDQKRIRLADIDGSGTTDIIYLGSNIVFFWYNQSGNSWSPPYHLTNFPKTDNLSSVTVVDLLGKGTACIVWSSPLPGEALQPMRYIDLMSQGKPHLLESTKNNLGAETKVKYAPSTKFYLEDLEAWRPWTTRLPFPVHVLERVETYDRISRNCFVSRYAYHHGYFDGIEREFRGFGMVEQWDTEEFAALSASDTFPTGDNIDQASHVPPVLTKTWFHTGAYQQGQKISKQFEDEYYRESDLSEGIEGLTDEQFQAMLLDDTVLPDSLTTEETREACRALKGSILRQEVYGLDGTKGEDRPYSVSESNYTIKRLQTQQSNKHAVFFVHPRETINFHYERKLFDIGGQKLADPRVSHSMTLEVDNYGNVLQSVAIGYGRRYDDPSLTEDDRNKQKQPLITYTENTYTNVVDEDDVYRTPLPAEMRTYELTGFDLPDHRSFYVADDFVERVDGELQLRFDRELPYEQECTSGRERRIIEHLRSLYYKNDLSEPFPLGEMGSLGLPYEAYKLAFTPDLLTQTFVDTAKIAANDLETVLRDEGGYIASQDYKARGWFPAADPDGYWWIPSGQQVYSPVPQDPLLPPDPLMQDPDYAQQHFYQPQGGRDPFGAVTRLTYDKYDLLLLETEDPLRNKVTVGERDEQGNIINKNDYRVLQPALVTDPNGNRSEVAFDTLGLVVGTAVMGKVIENKGDSLAGFKANLEQDEIDAFFTNPKGAIAKALLDKATTRIIYDVDCYFRSGDPNQPPYSATLARERHVSDLQEGEVSPIQVSFSYSDGFGREIQKKIQAEPGPVEGLGEDIDPRWVGSGWTIFNNKGKPVKQYEPFFDDTHSFRFGKQVGVSPILFYDPLERAIATLHPNNTYEKVVFDPWLQKTYDVNDTVLDDPRTDPDIAGFMREYFETQPETWQTWYMQRQDGALGAQEQAAAQKTVVHADTPAIAHLDVLGRPFLTIADNGVDENGQPQLYQTRVELDIEGNQREVIDAKGRVVMRYDYYMAGPSEDEEEGGSGNLIHQASMEAGERWMLNDVAGNPIRAWDSRNHEYSYTYDELRRPLLMHVSGGDGDTPLDNSYERIRYGDWKDMTPAERAQSEQENRIGKPFEHYDTAGKVLFECYDFKGNLKKSTRWLAPNHEKVVDWRDANLNALENEPFTTETKYDALNRFVETKTPDGSVTVPTYNEANMLNAVDVNLRGEQEGDQPKWTSFVTNIDYDAKGQRMLIDYGNGVRTTYEYDPLTFRLIHLLTRRDADDFPGDCPQPSPADWPGCQVQNLHYTYDPVGNITHIRDDAQQIIYFRNKRVEPNADYVYDAIYRLINATGREHLGQNANGQLNPPQQITHNHDDSFRKNRLHPGDGKAMGNYTEEYEYDEVGNILKMIHKTDSGNWTRHYDYETTNNRLLSTSLPGDTELAPYSAKYDYDAHGNMKKMPHLPSMEWDFKDQLHSVQRQVVNDGNEAEKAYYVYDAAGQRVRKVIVGQNGAIKKERIYLGGFEIYREYNPSTLRQAQDTASSGQAVKLERETLHIMDDQQRIALVETKTHDSEAPPNYEPTPVVRYQFSNHLGSASLELDAAGAVISYEEYYPYGSTSYQAGQSVAEVGLKRYRYTGKERDEESGLYYYGARYYAPWLGRWMNADPLGIVDGVNSFEYTLSSPLQWIDPEGTQVEKKEGWVEIPGARAALTNLEKWEETCSNRLCSLPEGWSVIGTERAGVIKFAYVLQSSTYGPVIDFGGEHEGEFLQVPTLRLVKEGVYKQRIEVASEITYSENKGWQVEWEEVGQPLSSSGLLWIGASGRADSTMSPFDFLGPDLGKVGRLLTGASEKLLKSSVQNRFIFIGRGKLGFTFKPEKFRKSGWNYLYRFEFGSAGFDKSIKVWHGHAPWFSKGGKLRIIRMTGVKDSGGKVVQGKAFKIEIPGEHYLLKGTMKRMRGKAVVDPDYIRGGFDVIPKGTIYQKYFDKYGKLLNE